MLHFSKNSVIVLIGIALSLLVNLGKIRFSTTLNHPIWNHTISLWLIKIFLYDHYWNFENIFSIKVFIFFIFIIKYKSFLFLFFFAIVNGERNMTLSINIPGYSLQETLIRIYHHLIPTHLKWLQKCFFHCQPAIFSEKLQGKSHIRTYTHMHPHTQREKTSVSSWLSFTNFFL